MPGCSHETEEGRPCRAYAVQGSDRCVSHLGRTGPAPSLTPALADQLVTLLRAGNYIGVATSAVGISRRTFNVWMVRGRSGAAKDRPFRELRERIEAARAEGEAHNVAIIAREARTNWTAAAWLLERQHPERWGRPSQRAPFLDKSAEAPPDDDVFAEVDELAAARRRRQGDPRGLTP